MDPSKLVISPLRISTMVATAHMGTEMNLQTLLECFHERAIPLSWPEEGVLKVEYKPAKEKDKDKSLQKKIVIGTCVRDELTKRKQSKNIFFNQSTLVIRREVHPTIFKEVNVKLFKNGGIQMTGIPTETFALETLQWISKELSSFSRPIFTKAPAPHRFSLQLINSDYSVNGTINREALHSILVNDYNLFSSFESTIYQAVDTKYFYNEALPPGAPEGICPCDELCDGNGDGKSLGACKKITISIFHTGSIIITGARSFKQVETAYKYMNTILPRHCTDIIKPFPPPKPVAPPKESSKQSKSKSKSKSIPPAATQPSALAI